MKRLLSTTIALVSLIAVLTSFMAMAADDVNALGNLPCNVLGGACIGLVAEQGDWLYYRTGDWVDAKLYKVQKNGKGKKLLYKGAAQYINAVGDWLYFADSNEDEALFKMKTDGSMLTPLTNYGVREVLVAGDWLYYRENYYKDSKKDIWHRMKTDGTQDAVLPGVFTLDFADAEYIYYRVREQRPAEPIPSAELYQMRHGEAAAAVFATAPRSPDISGGGYWEFVSKYINIITVKDGWLYYHEAVGGYYMDDVSYLYRVKPGGEKEKLAEIDFGLSNVIEKDGWLYYQTWLDDASNKRQLCKVRLDGTDFRRLATGNITVVNVADNWIYYNSTYDGLRVQRITINGKNKQTLT